MAKFSDRLGVTEPPKELQLKSMTKELRNTLWNLIVFLIKTDYQNYTFRSFLI